MAERHDTGNVAAGFVALVVIFFIPPVFLFCMLSVLAYAVGFWLVELFDKAAEAVRRLMRGASS